MIYTYRELLFLKIFTGLIRIGILLRICTQNLFEKYYGNLKLGKTELCTGISVFFMHDCTSGTTVFRFNFTLHKFCPSKLAILPNLEFTPTPLCFKRDKSRHWNSYSLKFAHWWEIERGKNKIKGAEYFPVNSIQWFRKI